MTSRESLREEIKEYYSDVIDFDKLLANGNFFSNTKQILLKEETGQMSLFN